MKCVYVLMYQNTELNRTEPYAVFEDSVTAEKMKRAGDEIWKVPYFEDKSDRSNPYTASPNSIHVVPCGDHTTGVTYRNTDLWGKESTTIAPPPYDTYPKVTCQKTIDEHTWRDRSD